MDPTVYTRLVCTTVGAKESRMLLELVWKGEGKHQCGNVCRQIPKQKAFSVLGTAASVGAGAVGTAGLIDAKKPRRTGRWRG